MKAQILAAPGEAELGLAAQINAALKCQESREVDRFRGRF
jgi:hypothetical protein